MDFAVCPSCGQSVLDDDAADCPFCGASMKAKPGAKPAGGAKPAAPTAKPTGTAASKPGAKPASKPDPKAAADDFPFDAEMLQANDAIAATPTSGKGRPLQVICPMCETTGYVPSSAAGKMVKCANSQCMVPLFKAPAPEAPKAAPPPEKPKSNPLMLGIITAVVVAALGGGAYVAVTMSGGSAPETKPLTQEDIDRMKAEAEKRKLASGTATTSNGTETPGGETTPVKVDETAAKAVKDRELQATILQSMKEWALLSSQNRSKPLCRRLAAEAFAVTGQIKEAREQIGALSSVGRDVPFYRVVPWVEVAWAEQAAKNDAAAKTALDSAVAESSSLPKFGRDRLVMATYLAAALTGAGRHADAHSMLVDRQSDDIDGEVAFVFCWLEFDQQLTEVEPLFQLFPLVPREATQTAATAAVAVLRGQPQAALAFAQAAPAGASQLAAFSGWAEALVWMKPATTSAEIEPHLATLPPAYQAYVWARAARVAASRKGTDAAKAFVAKAVAVLESQPVPAEFEIPPLKQLMKWRPTPPGDLLALATSAGELALAQQAVGDSTAAAASVNRMLSIARAIGPSVPSVSLLQKDLDRTGLNAMRERLKKDLDLRNDDDARQSLNIYRQALNDLAAGATTRFDFQSRALGRAARLGLEAPVWEIVSRRTAVAEAAQQEPYFGSTVPSWLLYRFEQVQSADDVNALVAAAGPFTSTKITTPVMAVAVDHFQAGRAAEGMAAMNDKSLKGDPREALALRGMIALLNRGDTAAAWDVIAKQEIVLREQAYQLAALLLARQGKAQDAWKRAADLSGVTEKESMARGIIGGLNPRK